MRTIFIICCAACCLSSAVSQDPPTFHGASRFGAADTCENSTITWASGGTEYGGLRWFSFHWNDSTCNCEERWIYGDTVITKISYHVDCKDNHNPEKKDE